MTGIARAARVAAGCATRWARRTLGRRDRASNRLRAAPRRRSISARSAKSRPVQVLDWTADRDHGSRSRTTRRSAISSCIVCIGDRARRPGRLHGRRSRRTRATTRHDSVALDPDEKAYVEAILAELKNVAKRDKVPELEEFAKQDRAAAREGRERRDHEGAAARGAREGRGRARQGRRAEPGGHPRSSSASSARSSRRSS